MSNKKEKKESKTKRRGVKKQNTLNRIKGECKDTKRMKHRNESIKEKCRKRKGKKKRLKGWC